VKILLDQRKIYGHLEKNQVVKAVERPWTRIIRTGTASTPENTEEDVWERRRRRLEQRKKGAKEAAAAEGGGRLRKGRAPPETDDDNDDDDMFPDVTNKVVVDPYVRNQLVEACLGKYPTAKAMRDVMVVNGVETSTLGKKGEERRVALANKYVRPSEAEPPPTPPPPLTYPPPDSWTRSRPTTTFFERGRLCCQ
jgi:hypothetical protein